MNEKSAEQILEELQQTNWDEMANEAEEDFEKIYTMSNECINALLENRIYLWENKKIFKNNVIGSKVAISKVDELVEELYNEEDIRNSKISINKKAYDSYKMAGFTAVCPSYEREDIPRIKIEIITSIAEYIEKVIYEQKEDSSLKTFYRGHARWDYELVPGVYRINNKNILQHESQYIKEIISSYPQYFDGCKSGLDYLSILQHNGFPTRLLDFSENPLIALYMTCVSDEEGHGDTMKISVPKEHFKYYDSDTASILANIAFAEDEININNYKNYIDREIKKEEIEKFNQSIEVTKLVHLIRNEKPGFRAAINPMELAGKIIFVKPKQTFARIAHQNGLFALFGICGNKNTRPKIEDMVPSCHITHYIIPASCKKKILEELAILNITEASVYCDLEHVAKHYINKNKRQEVNTEIKRREKAFE